MFSIALDGPAGAGKSSIARKIAERLRIIHVDTGAMYRSIAFYCIKNGVDTSDIQKVESLLPEISIELSFTEDGQRIFINKEDVTDKIRTSDVSMGASNVSSIPKVREFLLNNQRELAAKHSLIMDGRDIGTVILPDASVKIFLTASAEIRAERRLKEYIADGVNISFDEVLADVIKRDKQDMERKTAPLKQADDAILADTSSMDFDESVEYLLNIITERTK